MAAEAILTSCYPFDEIPDDDVAYFGPKLYYNEAPNFNFEGRNGFKNIFIDFVPYVSSQETNGVRSQ